MMFGGSSELTDDLTSVTAVAAGGGDPPVDPVENRRRWFAIAGATAGIVGFSAFLTTLYTGMRHVEAGGGFCASGGPYVIAHQCTAADTRQVFIGVIGMLIFGGLFVGLTAYADGPVLVPSGLLWAALFGSLGAGFVFLPKGTQSGSSNYGVGIPFLLMAAAGLWPAITSGLAWLRRGGEPEPETPAFGGNIPLVRAAVEAPAMNAPPSAPSAGPNKPVVPKRLVIPPKDGL
jgi:hypothetical protein